MHTAIADLGLDHLDLIHTGRETYPLRDRIRAVSIFRLRQDIRPSAGRRRKSGPVRFKE